MTVGIYGIFDINGQCLYVGQSSNVQLRWKQHLKKLKNGSALKNFAEWFAENDSSESSMVFKILETCEDTDEAKNKCEMFWFKKLSPLFFGKEPNENEVWSQSEATRTKIAESVKAHYEQLALQGKREHNLSTRILICKFCSKEFSSDRRKVICCSVKCSNKNANLTKGYNVLSDEDRLKICEDYRNGLSLRKVAKLFGVSHIAVRCVLVTYGITLRNHGCNK